MASTHYRKTAATSSPKITPPPAAPTKRTPDPFDEFAAVVRGTFSMRQHAQRFMAAVEPGLLWRLFLEGFESDRERQIHNCHCCRRFVEQYGNLVTINDEGYARSIVWDVGATPRLYQPSVIAMVDAIDRAGIAGAHYSTETQWGNGPTYDAKRDCSWSHFAVENKHTVQLTTQSVDQLSADCRERVAMVGRALSDWSQATVQRAVTILEADQLTRAEKVIGPARWLLTLHETVVSVKDRRRRDALLWKVVDAAPPAFAHIRGSMLATLLDDLAAGKPHADVARAFASKMDPLKYQRPTAAPSEGQIRAAEQLVQQLDSANAFKRRMARMEDIAEWMWRPRDPKRSVTEDGVFAHLKTQAPEPAHYVSGSTIITWDKFERTVLPNVSTMEYHVPRAGYLALLQLTTAADASAPPILQWDREDRRNPVAWYCYSQGSPPARFNLPPGAWVAVTGVTRLPARWHHSPNEHYGDGVVLVLAGAYDTQPGAAAIFPEMLRSEYHGARHVIEAHSQRTQLVGVPPLAGAVAGIDIRKGGSPLGRTMIRVMVGGVASTYIIDRWD